MTWEPAGADSTVYRVSLSLGGAAGDKVAELTVEDADPEQVCIVEVACQQCTGE